MPQLPRLYLGMKNDRDEYRKSKQRLSSSKITFTIRLEPALFSSTEVLRTDTNTRILSGGEKAAFDLLLDIHLKKRRRPSASPRHVSLF